MANSTRPANADDAVNRQANYVRCAGRNYAADIPSFSSACRTVRIGMPSKAAIESRSLSPVTIASAHAPIAQASTWMSSGSRKAEGTGMAGPSTTSAAVWKREIISRALWPLCANRFWNCSRWSTSSNSAMTRAEAQSVAEPSSSASTNREGFPFHNEPETSTLLSTTNFTRAPLCPGRFYFGANLVHG